MSKGHCQVSLMSMSAIRIASDSRRALAAGLKLRRASERETRRDDA